MDPRVVAHIATSLAKTRALSDRQTHAFVDHPLRGPSLSVSKNDIEQLSGWKFLSTALVYFLLQHFVPNDLLHCPHRFVEFT